MGLLGQLRGKSFQLIPAAQVWPWRQSFKDKEMLRLFRAFADERALADAAPPLADCQRGRLFAQQLAKFFLFFLPADE